jgi:hypothetical protein
VQSPEHKETKDLFSIKKPNISCLNSAKRPEVTTVKPKEQKPKEAKKNVVPEISPLSLANVEKLQHEGDIAELINKISSRKSYEH